MFEAGIPSGTGTGGHASMHTAGTMGTAASMDPSATLSLKHYSDYRDFLLGYYQAKRKTSRFFSYRFMAKRLGVDHAYVLRILRGKAHLAERHIGRFSLLCHLDQAEAEFFRTLVRFNKTKDRVEAVELKAKLATLASAGPGESICCMCGGKGRLDAVA
jgi:transcriptional regulator with XRE-family HTH domain